MMPCDCSLFYIFCCYFMHYIVTLSKNMLNYHLLICYDVILISRDTLTLAMKMKPLFTLLLSVFCALTLASCGGHGSSGGGGSSSDSADDASSESSDGSSGSTSSPIYLLPENVTSARFTIEGNGATLHLTVDVDHVEGAVWIASMGGTATVSGDLIDSDQDITFQLKPCKLIKKDGAGIVLAASPVDTSELENEHEAYLQIDNMEIEFAELSSHQRHGIIGNVGTMILTYPALIMGEYESSDLRLELNFRGAAIHLSNFTTK